MSEASATKAPDHLFSTKPTQIVVYEERSFDEPVIEPVYGDDGKTTGIRREVGRRKGTALHVRGEEAHLKGKLAYPIDGSDPIPYGPGKPGCWGRSAHGER
jgi:hypothetical protein